MIMALDPGIFRQYDIRGVVARDLTADTARAIGHGFAALLERRGIPGAVAVGRDNRPSVIGLCDALVDGLTAGGAAVVDIGVVPTPALYWALHHLRVVAGIQITGSHNPPEYNGFKLCVGHDSLHGAGIQELFRLASAPPVGGVARGRVSSESILDRYIDDIVVSVTNFTKARAPLPHCSTSPPSAL